MPRRLAITLLLLAALVMPALAQAPSGAPDPQKATIDRIREVGVALFAYLTDHPLPAAAGSDGDGKARDWRSCPPLSHEQASSLLVPKYLAAVPRTDGWGHPLELCLRRKAGAGGSIGVRSPGRDGRFEGTSYPVGAFPAAALDSDLVWVDGYFVRWPERPAAAE